jgi:hypothetical protein
VNDIVAVFGANAPRQLVLGRTRVHCASRHESGVGDRVLRPDLIPWRATLLGHKNERSAGADS